MHRNGRSRSQTGNMMTEYEGLKDLVYAYCAKHFIFYTVTAVDRIDDPMQSIKDDPNRRSKQVESRNASKSTPLKGTPQIKAMAVNDCCRVAAVHADYIGFTVLILFSPVTLKDSGFVPRSNYHKQPVYPTPEEHYYGPRGP